MFSEIKSRHLFFPKSFYLLAFVFLSLSLPVVFLSLCVFLLFPRLLQLVSSLFLSLFLLPLLPHLPLCPNKCLIFPMMIWLINLDKSHWLFRFGGTGNSCRSRRRRKMRNDSPLWGCPVFSVFSILMVSSGREHFCILRVPFSLEFTRGIRTGALCRHICIWSATLIFVSVSKSSAENLWERKRLSIIDPADWQRNRNQTCLLKLHQ